MVDLEVIRVEIRLGGGRFWAYIAASRCCVRPAAAAGGHK
jgi:hypothetical protein